ncbi:MAG: sigma-54 dependent transcriptional regulator [Magnetospirillum sp.]|nr:sigma-54 dependent transcriptional regulator [Magnetospirillum sp.]
MMKILVIEDETAFRQVLEAQMVKEGMEATGVGRAEDGLRALEQQDFDVVVTDLRLPDRDGIEVVKEIRHRGYDVPVLLMTAYASVSTAVAALQSGAADYLIKPVRVPDLIRRVMQIHELEQLKRENTLLRRIVQQDSKKYWFADTPAGNCVSQIVAKVSNTDMTVLITGESGTGKSMTARLIHSMSARAEHPLVLVNCGAIPESLVESELFGHVKGAFTGADKAKDGLFVGAHGGTLFLDEIGELPLAMQVKLLHVIEEKVVRPLGASRERPIDVRIIAATNRNLEQMVQDGTFRMDLFYRVNIFQVSMPSLREQREAIPSAIDFVLKKLHPAGSTPVRVMPEVMAALQSYPWPGNLRELENVLERASLLCEGGTIELRDLPPSIAGHAAEAQVSMPVEYVPGRSFRDQVAAFERQLILHAIGDADGDRRVAARNLGVGLSTLYRKLEEFNEPSQEDGA